MSILDKAIGFANRVERAFKIVGFFVGGLFLLLLLGIAGGVFDEPYEGAQDGQEQSEVADAAETNETHEASEAVQ